MPKRTIDDIAGSKYDDPEVRDFVLKSVNDSGTADRVVSGELVLPSVEDALRNLQIANGTFAQTPQEAALRDQNRKLMERLDSLEARIGNTGDNEGQ